jgi:hypothetical protein
MEAWLTEDEPSNFVAAENFEKTFFGIVLYVKSIHKLYPDICIPSIDLDEIYEKGSKIAKDLKSLPKKEIEEKYSFLFPAKELEYPKRISTIDILNNLGKNFGNYIYANFDKPLEMMNDLGNINIILEEIKKCNKRFFLVPIIGWTEIKQGHANLLLIDREKKIVERFEPNGALEYDDFKFDKVDKILKQIFVDLYDYKEYITPPNVDDICVGLQTHEFLFSQSKEIELIGEGLCVTWSFLYGILRIENPDKNSADLKEIAMDLITKKANCKTTLPRLTRNKEEFKCTFKSKQQRMDYEENLNKVITFILNFISERNKDMQEDIDKINKIFKIYYVLKGRSLYLVD